MQRRDTKHDRNNMKEWEQAMTFKAHYDSLKEQNALPEIDPSGNYKIAKITPKNGSEPVTRVTRNKIKDIAWIE